MVCATTYLQNDVGDPRFFLRLLNPNLVNSIFYLQSPAVLKNTPAGKVLTETNVHVKLRLTAGQNKVSTETNITSPLSREGRDRADRAPTKLVKLTTNLKCLLLNWIRRKRKVNLLYISGTIGFAF